MTYQQDEPMAVIHYDFPSAYAGVRLKGSVEVRTRSEAQEVVAKMNEEFGTGTHWVEVMNYTYAERLGQHAL